MEVLEQVLEREEEWVLVRGQEQEQEQEKR